MINKQTIISVYDEKLTLLQWLKSVNKALDEAVLTGVEVRQKGNATFTFVFTFEDGSEVESSEIVINKGDSVESASIVDGHLILTMTNEETIDAGNIKPVSSFGFDASRHLIVYYGDGTSQDLGLIKGVSSFSIDANQHLIVTYDNGTSEDLGSLGDYSNVDFVAKTLSQTNANYVGTSMGISVPGGLSASIVYNRYEEINGVLYLIYNIKIKNNTENAITRSAGQRAFVDSFTIYGNVASRLYDFAGNTAHDAISSATLITYFNGFLSNDYIDAYNTDIPYSQIIKCIVKNSTQANTIGLAGTFSSNVTFEANSEKYFTARVALTLI